MDKVDSGIGFRMLGKYSKGHKLKPISANFYIQAKQNLDPKSTFYKGCEEDEENNLMLLSLRYRKTCRDKAYTNIQRLSMLHSAHKYVYPRISYLNSRSHLGLTGP